MLTEGLKDPFNRTFFPWDKEKSPLWYDLKFLGNVRAKYDCLRKGKFYAVSAAMGCVAYARVSKKDSLLVIANNNPHAITYYLPDDWHGARCITGQNVTYCSVDIDANTAVILER